MKDITPSDSVVPVYLVPLTKEELIENRQSEKEREDVELELRKNKDSAISKLKKVGLTDDEIKAIIGGV